MAFHAQQKSKLQSYGVEIAMDRHEECCLFLVSPLSDINSALKNWCCVIEFHESLSILFKITQDHLQDYSLQWILMEFRS